METTRHGRINRPATPAQATRSPDRVQASHIEPAVPLEMAQQFVQAAHLGHQLGRVSIAGVSGSTIQAKLTVGARRVPDGVVLELKRRVHNTPWRFSDSFSGGISFHRTRGSVDFIYHMLPP